jgi:hypothetical protein
MAAYETVDVGGVSVGKGLGLLFDLDLGLVRFAPLAVLLLLAVIPFVLRGAARAGETGLLAVLILMMVASSATGNWNHGTSGPSRYTVWMFPIVAALLALTPTGAGLLARSTAWRALVVLAAAGQVAVAVARGTVVSPQDYLEHSRLARAVLDRWPRAYLSPEEVFRERTGHTEVDLDRPFVHEARGRCRKALARWKHAQALRARCGEIPEPARGFFDARQAKEAKARWVYVDYP